MKPTLILGLALTLMHGIGRCAEPTAEPPDVPFGHWTYDALGALAQSGVVEYHRPTDGLHVWDMTRYEFAVAVARAMKTEGLKSRPDYDERTQTYSLERHDAFAALRAEFSGELKELGIPLSLTLPDTTVFVAPGSWVYDALAVLVPLPQTKISTDTRLTRLQCARMVMQALKKAKTPEFEQDRSVDNYVMRDALRALRTELYTELVKINPRTHEWSLPPEARFSNQHLPLLPKKHAPTALQ